MSGSISSLGTGSDGVLSSDLIDSLRAVDEKAELDPIDTKLGTNSTKKTDLASLTTLANTLKSAVSDLSNDTNYLQRTTTVSNDAVSVTADAGTNVQDFTVHVDTLAKQDIYQSTGFSSKTSTFSTGDDTLNMTINGTSYSFSVSSSTTLTDLASMINDKLDGKATASLLDTGGSTPYRLIIKSDNTGADNAITLSSKNYTADPTSTNALTSLGYDSTANHLQTATDAKFTYNGINVTRSTNTISDLASGVTITLNNAQLSTDSAASVSIKQDWSKITDKINSFVSAYNNLVSNVETAVSYDSTKNTKGTFQGVSQINSLSKSVRQQLLEIDSQGRDLIQYGLSLNDSGTLEFDEDTFNQKVEDDPKDVQDYFSGSTTYDTTTYTGSAVSSGALDVTYKGLYINDTSIRFSTNAGSTAKENALALQEAINKAGVEGVTASVGSDGNVVLKSTTGEDIAITGDSSVLSTLGLKATTVHGHSTKKDGIFTKFDSVLKDYTDSSTGILTNYSDYLDTEKTSLTTQRAKLVASLDTKYDTMTKKWASYDSMISQMKSAFSSLSQTISDASSSS